MSKEIHLNEEKFKMISGFINTAYRDYLAARILFNAGQLYRAIIISNTSIEKYLKAYLWATGKQSKIHVVEKLFAEACKLYPELNAINAEFIKKISESYSLRYFDNEVFTKENAKFRITVEQYKSLAELDFTVDLLQNLLVVEFQGRRLQGMYHADRESKNQHLFLNNFVLSGIDKKALVESEQMIYRVRVNTIGGMNGLEEQIFRTKDVKDDGKHFYPYP
ncbi:HEPN domain-containing protein [Cohnella luojiensis]|uniref:HEPN domain-containing protein n=1 Tax=Cohnella luojiensis TaxID=652876 RepID=A0A4Y8M7M0_9BACL|nr:HEPN domain-containing protein [Cohnella luojiensis]TFE30825.1 HEPN domain-containing protein [Cohnella luojiensis]